jgi:hypothetical protein
MPNMQFQDCIRNVACNYGYHRIKTEIHLLFYRPRGQRAVANNKEPGFKRAINIQSRPQQVLALRRSPGMFSPPDLVANIFQIKSKSHRPLSRKKM